MGLGTDPQDFRTTLWNLPDVVLVSAADGDDRIRARFFSADAPHRAAPVTSSIALACAMSVDGCITASAVARRRSAGEDAWEIQHPSGKMNVWVQANADRTRILSASVLRTARLLMEGNVLIAD